MALIGRMHPLLVHFPIGLVLMAGVAELMATFCGQLRWRTVAIANIRAGAAFGLVAAIAGWRLASAPGIEPGALLESHRWAGAIAVVASVAAALAAAAADRRSRAALGVYRATLFAAAALIAVTGHLGGLMVWGSDFLRP